jgi:DNA-binding beta-propeller fold protein YncE
VLAEPNPALGRPAQVVHLKIDASQAKAGLKAWILSLLIVPLIGLVIGAIALFAGLMPLLRSNKTTSSRPTRTTRPGQPMGGQQTSSGPASVLLKFGSEGIGPGMFSDARSIAVDGSGKIYVGEYTGGRVQVFDPNGKFISQINVDPEMPLRGMTADRKGTVYIVQRGKVRRFDGNTGRELGDLKFSGGDGFDDITTAADGGLVGVWDRGRDDLVRFDSSGNVVRTITKAISSASGRSELNMRVAIDGIGNIYALGTFNNAVFKFGPDGRFINRFGGSGEKSGQFRAPQAIAVDGKGRVFVSDINGIQIFDGDGRYIDVFDVEGSASGMVFNDNNELFIAARKQVIKLSVQ